MKKTYSIHRLHKRKFLFFLCLTIIFGGCVNPTYRFYSYFPDKPKQTLSCDRRIYISVPADAQYHDDLYSGSGQKVALVLQKTLLNYSKHILIGRQPEEYSRALSLAQSEHYDYLVYPEILHWEDRMTVVSNRPDQIQINIIWCDLKTNEIIDKTDITGISGGFGVGFPSPEDLLEAPVKEYIESLF